MHAILVFGTLGLNKGVGGIVNVKLLFLVHHRLIRVALSETINQHLKPKMVSRPEKQKTLDLLG